MPLKDDWVDVPAGEEPVTGVSQMTAAMFNPYAVQINANTAAIEALPGTVGTVQSVVAGTSIDVDSSDPAHPVVSVEALTVSNFEAAVIVTEAEGLNSSDNETSIPTTAAVKDYVDDAVLGGAGGTVDTVVAGTNIDVDSTNPAHPIISVEVLTPADIGLAASVTELDFVDGVTSSIQAQLNAKASAVPRVTSIASSATPTFNTDNIDALDVTALTTAITSMTSGRTGTLNNFQHLLVRISSAAAQAIAWGSDYVDGSVPLPTATVAGKILMVGFIVDAAGKLACEASGSRA